MASPPSGPGGPVLEDKVKIPSSSLHEASLDSNVASDNSTLDTKAATLKIADEMADSQANQPPVHANGSAPAVVNGHTNDNNEMKSNGVDAPAPATNHHQPEQKEREQPVSPVSQNPQGQVQEDAPATEAASSAPGQSPDPGNESAAMPDATPTAAEDSQPQQSQDTAPTTVADKTQPQDNALTPAEESKQPLSPSKEEATAESPAAPAVADVKSDTSPAPMAVDVTDTTAAGTTVPVTPPEEKPIAEEKPVLATAELPSQDQEMTDAPPVSPTKPSREREDDASEEPAAKRPKTEEAPQGDAQFKVPETPASAAGTTTTAAAAATATTPVATSSEQQYGAITKPRHRALSRALSALKRSHDSRFFREPVDTVKLNIPTYYQVITQPMDLQKMEEKFKLDQYQTVDEFIADLNLMVNNSVRFNGPDHVVSIEAKNLLGVFDRHLAKLPSLDEVDPTPAEKKAQKAATPGTKEQPPRESRNAAARKSSSAAAANAPVEANAAGSPTTFALGPEGMPLIRRDSSAMDGRPKRTIHPPKNRDLPYSTKPKKKKFQWELKFCQEVLDEMHKQKHYSIAAPFYYPVDPVALNIPTYHSIIKKPMDLQTIQAKMRAGSYENAKEFEADVRQIFKNCFKFNLVGEPIHTCGKKLEELFQHKWAQKKRWLDNHKPASGQQSGAATSENESEEEEEESEDDGETERLNQLQKQMAEMSKQIHEITQKKSKKTPPTGSSKKAGGKHQQKSGGGSKKEGQKKSQATSGKKDKKPAKPKAKPQKQRLLTYHEKQLISSGFESLNDKAQGDALKIIQNNVPSLRNQHGAELELDMDELPNEVLLLLLDFVKKHAPPGFEFDEPPPPAPMPSLPQQSRPKKNKPMSKHEQEANINILEGKLKNFEGGNMAAQRASMANEAAVESSDDDEDSEESEEE